MLYVIEWYDGFNNSFSCVCPDNQSAWRIYWVLKQTIEKTDHQGAWIKIFCSGLYLNPLTGQDLFPLKNQTQPHIFFDKGVK